MSDPRDLLAVYRPGLDDDDPQFADALRQLRADPALQQWHEPHRQFDAAIRAKLAASPPPAGLRDRLLAQNKIRRWALHHPLAVAAAGLLLGVATYFWLQTTRRDTLAGLRMDMVKFVSRDYPLDVHSERETDLRAAFAAAGWPSTFTVPVGLQRLALEGGCRVQWRGRPVAMLCYATPDSGDVWLFVVARSELADTPAEELPPVHQRAATMATAAWSDADFAYLLVAEREPPSLHRYFLPTP